eukprot:575769-Prorocentrum_minimum.AAC.1
MEGKPGPEMESYALLDPKGTRGGGAPASGEGGARGRGPTKEALVFVIGGGNYREYQSCMELATRNPQAPKSIVYGVFALVLSQRPPPARLQAPKSVVYGASAFVLSQRLATTTKYK